MVQTVLVLIILTGGSLWFTRGRAQGADGPARQRARAQVELVPAPVYGALLVVTLILVLIWR